MSVHPRAPRIRCGRAPAGVLAVTLGTLLAATGPARAQSAGPDGDIRVIETVDPVSGQRYRQAIYDLTREEIKVVQRALRAAGYLGVGWTGTLDHGTVRALDELQRDRGLSRCGCVSYETIVALGLTPAVQVTTVATGGSAAGAAGTNADTYCHGCDGDGFYPVPVPIPLPSRLEPSEPPEPAPYPPPGALPPGVRPLPAPTRNLPSSGGHPRSPPRSLP